MAEKNIRTISRYIGGISEYLNESSLPDSYAFGQSIDVRSNPQNITLLPRTIKESSTIITALPKWGEYIPLTANTYIYDESGNIYQRTTAGVYTNIHTTPSSHGNGLSYFAEDDFLYYTSDKLIGRYGPFSASAPTFVDDFFGSQGGVKLNTYSLDLESSSSQYASRADTASLSITANLSLECYIKPESVPTSGNTMTLISKWDENGNIRSYKMGIGTVAAYFGDGSDGAITISVNTTDTPIDSACTGTVSTYTLSATNASFAALQFVFIHQSQGTGAGNWQKNQIQSYTAGTITLVNALNATYSSGAQVLVMKQYSSVTVNNAITWTAKAWTGTVGGILAFLCNGTVTVTGTVNATGRGFRGGVGFDSGQSGQNIANVWGYYAEGTGGASARGGSTASNGNGAGASGCGTDGNHGASGTGGGNASNGTTGAVYGGYSGVVGDASGSADLTSITFGGGGAGGAMHGTQQVKDGGAGGGIVYIAGITVTITGSVVANGNGGAGQQLNVRTGCGGGGAGGSVLIKSQTATLGTALITATGGAGGSADSNGLIAGNGGDGRIHIDYLTSYTGTTSPTITPLQDNSLASSAGLSLFLSISSNGTNTETTYKPITLVTGLWQHVAVTRNNSTKVSTFYLNSVSLGTQTGALTAINDNASRFAIGCDFNNTAQDFYDGLIDEARVWNTVRTSAELLSNMSQYINTASSGLAAYYKLNNDYVDATVNANNLTATNAPVFSVDIPYNAPTTRLDIDQTATATGSTYTLTTGVSESAANLHNFTPTKDPQKSISFNIGAVGTGDWTVTIHDAFNNVIATSTVTNANLNTGVFEFTFSSVWRPLTNFTNVYHFHITSTVADGTVVTSASNDLTNVTFTTYYQFLVEDTSFHPIAKMLQFLVFGNERYIAKLEATLYEPNKIILPANFRIRAFGYWQEYLAIGVIKGTSVTEQDIGRVYFWDGIAPTYNFFIDVPQGGVTALLGSQGKLYIWAGYQGQLMVYEGGNSVRKLRQLPFMTTSTYAEMYPGAVTGWKSLIRWGAVGNSNSMDIYRGVYTYGAANEKYPEILTYDYPVSTGTTQSTGLRIGMLLPVNQKLLIGWADGTGYGVDYVDDSNACYPTGTIEFLYDDYQAIWKEKSLNTFATKVKALSSGQSITPKVRLDDATSWTSDTATTSASTDPTMARMIITNERNYEMQLGLDISSTSGVSPIIKGSGILTDINSDESRV